MTVPIAALHALPSPITAAAEAPPDGAVLGRVRAIALRTGARHMPADVPDVLAEAGRGLAHDIHADPLSPRQVLLAGTPAYARHGLSPHALRENLLLDVDTARFTSGTLLRVGPQALLRLTFACEACGYLDARSPGLAATIGRARGMLARVVRTGVIAVGDPVVQLDGSVTDEAVRRWSDDWRERVAAILARVPPGMVIEYRHLARLAGVQAVYCRAFPRLVRSLGFAHAAVPMHGMPGAPRWQGNELFEAAVR